MTNNRSRVGRGVPTGGQFKAERKSAVLEPVVEGKFTLEIDESGTQRWRDADGNLGREDGPAVIYPNGISEWWDDDGDCYAVDVPEAQLREFSEMANRIQDELFSSNKYDPEIPFGVSFSGSHIEVSIEYYEKYDYHQSTFITDSIRIDRRDASRITEELGGDTFTVSGLLYKNDQLSAIDCTEFDDLDVGPLRDYDDIMAYIDDFLDTTQYEVKRQMKEGTAFSEDPDDDPWFRAGYSEDYKKKWSKNFTLDEAEAWCVNFTPEEAEKLDRSGITVLSATDWKDHGFSVRDTVRYVLKGYSTPEEAKDD